MASGSVWRTVRSPSRAYSSDWPTSSPTVHDPVFWQVAQNTFVYTFAATALKMVGGLALALVMNQEFRFKNLIRAVMLLPFIVPTVLSTIAWMWILDPSFSVINWFLVHWGIANPGPSWLGNPYWAMFSLIMVNTWRGLPFYAITLLAGLQTISPELYEAATIDGASTFARFRYVTAAAAEAGDLHRDDVLGDLHLLGLPAGLCADPRWPGQRHTSVRYIRVRRGDERRAVRSGRIDRAVDVASAGIVDRRHGLVHAGRENMIVEKRGFRARSLKLWLPLGFFMIFTLFPFYWMAITSLKPNSELYSRKIMPLVVYHPTLEHFVNLLSETSFPLWTYNTMLVAVVSTAISLVFGVMLAYPLARMKFPGAALISFAVAATYLVPQPLLFIPLADIINRLGLGDTLTSVILTYPTLLVPFCAWLLMGYFKSVPHELEDAARIDGATRLQTMFRIFLPLCIPGFISAGIFAFTLAQNEFLYALIFLTKTDVRTVPVGAIAELVRGDVFYWGQLMAAALLGSIPVAIIYSFFVEHYVAGLTSGGVKA